MGSNVVISNVLLLRMSPFANTIIEKYQCGFRRNRSTIKHIFSIWKILENKWEYNNEIKSQIKGNESENSYQELKRSRNDRHTQTHGNCNKIFRLARPSSSIERE